MVARAGLFLRVSQRAHGFVWWWMLLALVVIAFGAAAVYDLAHRRRVDDAVEQSDHAYVQGDESDEYDDAGDADDAYDDAEDEDEDEDEAESITLDDLRKLRFLASDNFQVCVALTGNTVMSWLSAEYVPTLGRATDFKMTPEMIETAAEQIGAVVPMLKDRALRDAHTRLAQAIRTQKGKPVFETTPEMTQAYVEIARWVRQNCTEESYGLSKGELDDRE